MQRALPIVDAVVWPLVYPAAYLLQRIRKAGVHKMPRSRAVLERIGVFPIRNHYYEPQFDHRGYDSVRASQRTLRGIDWNEDAQIELLSRFRYASEIADIADSPGAQHEFRIPNGSFEPGDAECWYQMLRLFKPRRVIEIGSGNSTKLAVRALQKNRQEDAAYTFEHVCVEPYEMPWLEELPVTVVRRRVEELGVEFFGQLEANDILFIDSSHVIRPQGDVLFEYLEVLPTLAPGVIVHVHDIFSPRDYPLSWVRDEVRLWNEQYLVEAFLSDNSQWEVLCALNYLHVLHPESLRSVAPFLRPSSCPGSLYIRRRG